MQEKHSTVTKSQYSAIHQWIKRNYGKAAYCLFDRSHKSKYFEWANITGVYVKDITHFIPLCLSCHKKYDYTEEMRRKMSNRMKGKVSAPTKSVIQLKRNGSIVNKFISLSEAGRKTKVLCSAICNSLNGRSKSAGGFIWQYE